VLVAGAGWAWVEFLILVWWTPVASTGPLRLGTYLLVSDRGRFGGLRSGGTRLGCAGQFRLPSGVPLMGDRWGMGEDKGGCGRRVFTAGDAGKRSAVSDQRSATMRGSFPAGPTPFGRAAKRGSPALLSPASGEAAGWLAGLRFSLNRRLPRMPLT
jgi:hypothetical protein